ncbi:MAG TPA: hypothetical protein DD429_00010 [Clostridiaceae bacterium]|nr:hypothetical protein [Clostridiaceae bacterium]
MSYSKAAYVKSGDIDVLVKNLKTVMQTYDMEFDSVKEDKYRFSRYGEYHRSFIIKQWAGGWIAILDDDGEDFEQLCSGLSKGLSCFILAVGFKKEVLHYTVYNNGIQIGEYMSSLKYYEYPINDDVRTMYEGDERVFKGLTDDDGIEKIGSILRDCSAGRINKDEALYSLQKILGMVLDDDAKEDGLKQGLYDKEQEEVLEANDSLFEDVFYVDFESINIKTNDMDSVLSTVENICIGMGYSKTDEFSKYERKGFFKKMLGSIKERKRIQFFICKPLDGWVTLVGEMEKLYGDEPSEWEFVHIEDKLSKSLDKKIVAISANTEGWGFKVFNEGNKVYEYRLGDVVYIEDIEAVLPEFKEDDINSVFEAEIKNAKDVDNVLGLFCSILGIKNYKINIPMDYSEDEYYNNVLKLLPGCEGIINLKFEPEN